MLFILIKIKNKKQIIINKMESPMKSIRNYLKSNTFRNKNVIITGAAGAIGSETVHKLLLCGAKVVGFVHKQNKINPYLVDFIKTKQLQFIQIDFNDCPKITEKYKEAMLYLGGKLDILIFCHGKFFGGDFRKTKTDNFDQNMRINVRANFHLLSLSIPFLKISKGNVVMMSSMETKIVERGEFLHALSKSMINSLVENSALELASYGVRVNGVAPSFVNSKYRVDSIMKEDDNEEYLNQMKEYSLLGKKVLGPDEVADTILFLASNEARFMTGEIITIDCGFELNHDLSFLQDDEDANMNP
jgi:NAD(P)-dependent dehydrogenase (short-subunit alcohol dehydrogenase family)